MSMIKTTLAEQAYQELRVRIVRGQLPRGHRLLPTELAADLGISPTPVKEACLRLEGDGLVVTSARRGMVVRSFTEGDIKELYAARLLIEKGAIEAAFDAGVVDDDLRLSLAASVEQHRKFARGTSLDDLAEALVHDRAFHSALVGASRIPMISDMHNRILGQTHTLFVSVPGNYDRSIDEHQDILEAINAGDKNRTVQVLLFHLHRSRDNTLHQSGFLSQSSQA